MSEETRNIAEARGYKILDAKHELEGFELVDSGHIFGSKSLLIEGEIFYTSDLSIRNRAYLNGCMPKKCRALIIEATYGQQQFVFPSTHKIIEQTNRAIADCYDKGLPVILMGYPLGKAQELTYLFSHWSPIYVHDRVYTMNWVHKHMGLDLPDGTSLSEAREKGLLEKSPWMMISPMVSRSNQLIEVLKEKYKAKTIGFSGWSLIQRYRHYLGLDYSFPLSDHCDYTELMQFVKACEPEYVYTFHGYAEELAQSLRKLGYEAEPLKPYPKITDYFAED
ncbi:MAG: MBL fold metallo-hydrolase RNA specificity domain-containing protein [Nitrososphaerales archaeon]